MTSFTRTSVLVLYLEVTVPHWKIVHLYTSYIGTHSSKVMQQFDEVSNKKHSQSPLRPSPCLIREMSNSLARLKAVSKCSRMFLVPCQTHPENFMKNPFIYSFAILLTGRQTSRQTYGQMNRWMDRKTGKSTEIKKKYLKFVWCFSVYYPWLWHSQITTFHRLWQLGPG